MCGWGGESIAKGPGFIARSSKGGLLENEEAF
jgi:hypothetical protein